MQISKFLLAAGTVGVLVASVPAVASPDNAAQAKMREALRQKMEEVNAQTAAPPTASQPAPAAPAPQTAPPAARPATVVVPVPVEPAVVVTPAAVSAAKSGSVGATFSEVPVETEDAKVARLQEAMRQQLAAEKAATATVAATAPVAPAVKSAPVVAAPFTASVETIPSPFSSSKQERLAELLRRYKADEITPQEYHTKRAAIVAEP